MFDEKEKKVIKALINQELEKFEKEEHSIIEKSISEVELETKYEDFLKQLLKKI